ncbi:hypothetical protein [Paramuribaculum intestinale]
MRGAAPVYASSSVAQSLSVVCSSPRVIGVSFQSVTQKKVRLSPSSAM